MGGCPLCISGQTTHWYDDSHPDFRIVDCPVCGQPAAVARIHGTHTDLVKVFGQRTRIVDYCAQFFGLGSKDIDVDSKCVEGHVHAHVRRGT